jgi:hypothetical protein
MPRKPKPPALVGGPYQPPPCEVGSSLRCLIRGRQTVAGITDAPIPWPWAWQEQGGGHRLLIVCGGLAEAIRTETTLAVAHHWGVGRKLVTGWRRALGVDRMTPGTLARWRQLAPRKLPRAARARGGQSTAFKRTSRKGAKPGP